MTNLHFELPSNWREITLGDCGTWFSGGTPDTTNPKYWNGDIPWITASSLKNFRISDSERRVTELGVENGTRLVPRNTIIFVVRGMSLKKEFRTGITQRPVAFGQDCKALIAHSAIEPVFLGYLLQAKTSEILGLVDEASHGTGRLQTNLLQSLIVALPPLPEQRKIAEILSTWDEAIDLTEQLITAKQKRKQALMQQLLTGKVRFPGFVGEWQEYLLEDIASLTAGGTPSTKVNEYWNGDIRWMNSGEINLRYVYEVEGRITKLGLDNSSAKLIPQNSVMIALAGQGKTRGMVAINKIETTTNQSIAAIMPDSAKLHYKYLFFNLDNRYNELRSLSGGDGGRGGLNLTILKNVVIPLPSIKEQHWIAEVLTSCDHELSLLQQKLDALRLQKKGLMQQLLTGKIRVNATPPQPNREGAVTP